jgi:O-succinylbenzoate synthase
MSVAIAGARLWEVALPLRLPFAISGGVMRVRRSLIVELRGTAGGIGFGESAPFELPFYSSETIASATALLTGVLLPRLVGARLERPVEAHETLVRGVRGNPFARAGAETAVWDLFAAQHGLTLTELMSAELERLAVPADLRQPADAVSCGVALGIPQDLDPATVRAWTRQALQAGYRRVKVKIRPGWDVQPIRAAREGMNDEGRDVPLWADANAAYDLREHIHALRAIDALDLLFIEQPLQHDDLCDHARLARELRTPICLDESLRDARWARQALELDASRIWNVKVQRLGGLAEALRVYAMAAAETVALWGGTMPETGLGARTILTLGTLPRFVHASDVEASERWYEPGTDLIELDMAADGTMPRPAERGTYALGVADRLRQCGRLIWASGG